jgi:hypothetical protein
MKWRGNRNEGGIGEKKWGGARGNENMRESIELPLMLCT